MVSCTINLDVINWATAKQNETFRRQYDTTQLKINGSKTISSFDEAGNQPGKLSNNDIQKLSLSSSDVTPTLIRHCMTRDERYAKAQL